MADKIIKKKDGSLGGIKKRSHGRDSSLKEIRRRKKQEKGAEIGGESGFKFMNEDPTTKQFNIIDMTTGETKKMTFSKGGKVKLALRGGGRAYGKNS